MAIDAALGVVGRGDALKAAAHQHGADGVGVEIGDVVVRNAVALHVGKRLAQRGPVYGAGAALLKLIIGKIKLWILLDFEHPRTD